MKRSTCIVYFSIYIYIYKYALCINFVDIVSCTVVYFKFLALRTCNVSCQVNRSDYLSDKRHSILLPNRCNVYNSLQTFALLKYMLFVKI